MQVWKGLCQSYDLAPTQTQPVALSFMKKTKEKRKEK